MKYEKNDLKNLLYVIASSFIYSIAIKAFVEAKNLYPGGFTGLSRLMSDALFHFFNIAIPFSVFYMAFNIVVSLIVFRYVGKKFTILSIVQFSLTSFLVNVMPAFPATNDFLLVAVFGGILSGASAAIALRAGASSGGTDFLAIFYANKYKVATWNYVMAFNVCILMVVGVVFSWERALYSIIFQFCSMQVVSALHTRYKFNTLFIITKFPIEVCDAVFKTCRHGITRLDGTGAYTKSDVSMLVMTASAYEISGLCQSIKTVDPKAFITINKTEKIVGNYYQKPLE